MRKSIPKKSYGGSILSNAGSMSATGFTIGGPVGAAIGAGVGGVLGFLQEKARKNELAKQKQLEEERIKKEQLFLNRQADKQIMANFPTYGVNQSFFAKGGYVFPEYEAEDEEVIQFNPGDKPKVHDTGYLQQHSSTTATIKGKSHLQGGEDMSGGERIFSDKIYFDSKKDADIINSLKKMLKNL